MKDNEQPRETGRIPIPLKQPIEDWIKTVWEHFYIKYAVPAMKQHPEAEALSQLQEKIEGQLNISVPGSHLVNK